MNVFPSIIKNNNILQIYQLLYEEGRLTPAEIAAGLSLSRPTVAAALSSLQQAGLIETGGQFITGTAGRRAGVWAINPLAFVGVGVKILPDRLYICAADLYGTIIKSDVYLFSFEDTEAGTARLCRRIRRFMDLLGQAKEHVGGIGIAVDALVSGDGERVLFGTSSPSPANLRASALTKQLGAPCLLIRASECEALTEMWLSSKLRDACYLSVNWHLDAAVLSGGALVRPRRGQAGAIAHFPVQGKGSRTCICGQKGCLDACGSLSALSPTCAAAADLPAFMHRVRNGEPAAASLWDRYLKDLAQAIRQLHLACDTQYILGGMLASLMTASDLNRICSWLQKNALFPEPLDYVSISRIPGSSVPMEEAAPLGAALSHICLFLADPLQQGGV